MISAFLPGVRRGLVDQELDYTTRGIVGGMVSTINDFGINRRIEVDATGTTTGRNMDTAWGRQYLHGRGRGMYVAPVGDAAVEIGGRMRRDVGWRTVQNTDELYGAWDRYIKQGAHGPNANFFGQMRNRMYEMLGGGSHTLNATGGIATGEMSAANRFLARAGGVGTMLPAGIALYFAGKDAHKGYQENGVFGAITGAAKGYATGAMGSRVVGMSLMNPATAGLGFAAVGAVGYTGYKTFAVRNEGNEIMQQKRMSMSGWQKGPTQAFTTSSAMTMRGRSIMAMENSRFNAMKALGNEAYMASAPKSRYANSTSIGNSAPILSY